MKNNTGCVGRSRDDEFPFKKMDQVIVRNTNTTWSPAFFKELYFGIHDKRSFATFENRYEMIAPLGGNENRIGTKKDSFGLWDLESLEEAGFLPNRIPEQESYLQLCSILIDIVDHVSMPGNVFSNKSDLYDVLTTFMANHNIREYQEKEDIQKITGLSGLF